MLEPYIKWNEDLMVWCLATQLQLLGGLAGVELSLLEAGYPVKLGSGVAAAQACLSKQTPTIASRI